MGGFELAEILEGRPVGAAMWIRVLGTSMSPLLRSGDALQVIRCGEPALARGDIAILRRSDGALVAHLVTSTGPLRTATFSGVPDTVPMRVLGRASAVRRGTHAVPLPSAARWPLWGTHRLLCWARGSEPVRAAARGLRSAAVAWARRLHGPPRVRALGPDDLEAVILFCGDTLGIPAAQAQRRLGEPWPGQGAALGAFLGERLVAYGCVVPPDADHPRWTLRWLHVSARGEGIDRPLVSGLCAEAVRRGADEVQALTRAEDPALVRALLAEGFRWVGEGPAKELRKRLPEGEVPRGRPS